MMAVLNFRLACFLFLVMPVLLLVIAGSAKVKVLVNRNRQSFTRFSAGVQFMLQRIDLTRYQSAEDFERRRQERHIEALRDDSEKMAWLQTAYSLAQNSAVMFAGTVILVMGGMDVAEGHSFSEG